MRGSGDAVVIATADLWVVNEALTVSGVRGQLTGASLFQALNDGLQQDCL